MLATTLHAQAVKTVRDVHTAVSKLKPPKPASAAGGGAKVVDCFVESMGAWLEQSGAILEQLREQLKRTTRVFGVCARRVCADANDGPEVLYGRLATFRMQWRDASAENAAAAARAAREAWLDNQKRVRRPSTAPLQRRPRLSSSH